MLHPSDSSPHKSSPASTSPVVATASESTPTAAPQALSPQAAPQAGSTPPPAAAVVASAQGSSGPPDASGSAPRADAGSSAVPQDSTSGLPATGETPIAPPASPVQMAQMVSKAAQSEMHIGMNTAAFGSVEVHTVVRANEVGVVIGSERGDLRSLLSTELSAVANTLQQQNLRLHQVNFHQGFAFSSSMSSGGDSQSRSFNSRQVRAAAPAETPGTQSSEPVEPTSTARSSGISILA